MGNKLSRVKEFLKLDWRKFTIPVIFIILFLYVLVNIKSIDYEESKT